MPYAMHQAQTHVCPCDAACFSRPCPAARRRLGSAKKSRESALPSCLIAVCCLALLDCAHLRRTLLESQELDGTKERKADQGNSRGLGSGLLRLLSVEAVYCGVEVSVMSAFKLDSPCDL